MCERESSVCVVSFIRPIIMHVKSQHVRDVIKDDALCLLKGQALSDVFNIWEQGSPNWSPCLRESVHKDTKKSNNPASAI
jgi:hypothetical protein